MDRKMLASEILKIARDLVAAEFPTQEALDKYLKDHPDADRSSHRVVEKKKAPASSKGKGLAGPVYDKFKSLEKMDEKTMRKHVEEMVESKGIDQVMKSLRTLYKHLSDNGAGMNDLAVVQEAINHAEKMKEKK